MSGYWWWALPAILLVVGILYLSIGAGSVYAFTDWNGFTSPNFVGFQNFTRIFADPLTRTALINTLVIAIAFLVLTNVLGLGFALALNRQLKSRHFLRVVLFAPVVLSPLAVSYVWQFIFQFKGPLNQFLGAIGLGAFQKAWLGDPQYAIFTIIAVMVWQHIGLVMVIYLAGLANVPPELEEAAALDGAGLWKRFWNVTVHLIRPSIVIASVLMLIQGLKVFDQVIGLTGGGPFNATETLATQVWRQTFINGQFGYGAALSLVLTLIVIIFSLVQMWLLRSRESN
ncbi:carbohydrate ABC transporter permease [Leifsonia sp. NPDC058194]|uniref:carbohydrate ABC transporter permease n=1 Tax=Leifsonia sp. NPDC058194 TaxID=3346374 RepID=UPI0036D84E0E